MAGKLTAIRVIDSTSLARIRSERLGKSDRHLSTLVSRSRLGDTPLRHERRRGRRRVAEIADAPRPRAGRVRAHPESIRDPPVARTPRARGSGRRRTDSISRRGRPRGGHATSPWTSPRLRRASGRRHGALASRARRVLPASDPVPRPRPRAVRPRGARARDERFSAPPRIVALAASTAVDRAAHEPPTRTPPARRTTPPSVGAARGSSSRVRVSLRDPRRLGSSADADGSDSSAHVPASPASCSLAKPTSFAPATAGAPHASRARRREAVRVGFRGATPTIPARAASWRTTVVAGVPVAFELGREAAGVGHRAAAAFTRARRADGPSKYSDMREGKRPDGGSAGRWTTWVEPRLRGRLWSARAAAGSTAPAACVWARCRSAPPPAMAPPKMPVITGDAEIVEFASRDEIARSSSHGRVTRRSGPRGPRFHRGYGSHNMLVVLVATITSRRPALRPARPPPASPESPRLSRVTVVDSLSNHSAASSVARSLLRDAAFQRALRPAPARPRRARVAPRPPRR